MKILFATSFILGCALCACSDDSSSSDDMTDDTTDDDDDDDDDDTGGDDDDTGDDDDAPADDDTAADDDTTADDDDAPADDDDAPSGDAYTKAEVCEQYAAATCETLVTCGVAVSQGEDLLCLPACAEIVGFIAAGCEDSLSEDSYDKADVDSCMAIVGAVPCEVVCGEEEGGDDEPPPGCDFLAELGEDDEDEPDAGAAANPPTVCSEDCL